MMLTSPIVQLGAAIHAVVDKMPDQSVDIWVKAGTVATIAAALAACAAAWYAARLAKSTDALAVETGKAVRAGFEAARADEQRHQEGLQPHVAVYVDITDRQRAIWAHNVGPGFARNVTYRIKSAPSTIFNPPNEFYPLAIAPGEKVPLVSIVDRNHDIQLDYLDAFGNHFRTSASNFPEDQTYTCEKVVDTLSSNP